MQFIRRLFANEIFKTIFISLITVVFTLMIQSVSKIPSKRNMQQLNSIILYQDIKGDVDLIKHMKSIDGIAKNKHSKLSDRYLEILMSLNNRLDSEDYRNIIVHYNNMDLVEELRSKRWEEENSGYNIEYKNFIKELYNDEDSNELFRTLEKLRKIAKLKELT